MLWVVPGEEAKFLAPLDVREIPGVGKVTETNLHALGIAKLATSPRSTMLYCEERFGKWGLALGRQGARRRCRRMVRHRGRRRHRRQIHQPRAHLQRGHRRPRAARIHADAALARWSAAACAKAGLPRPHHPAQAALQGFHHHHPRPHAARSRPNSTPKSSSRSAPCSARTGKRERKCGCWACRPRHFATAARPNRSARRRAPSALASKRWPPPTACATSSASPASLWPRD